MQIVFVVSEVFGDQSASTKLFVQGVSRTPNAFVQVLPGNCDMATALRSCREATRIWFEGVGPLLMELVNSNIDLSYTVPSVTLRASSETIRRLPLPAAWRLLTNVIVPTASDVGYVRQRSAVPQRRRLVSVDGMGNSQADPLVRLNAMQEILNSKDADCSNQQWQEFLDLQKNLPSPEPSAMPGPLVTVAMFAYNEERSISAAIDSVRNQTYQNLEILVIDDGSTDSTAQIIQKHAEQDPRVRLVRQENAGIPRTRNRLIELAHGDYIAWLGADDRSMPRRVELELQAALDTGADVVHTDSFVLNADGRLQFVRRYRQVTPSNMPYMLIQGCYGQFWPVLDTSALVRRDLYERLGGYNEKFPRASDPEFFTRCAEAGDVKFAHVPEPLVLVDQNRPPADLERLLQRTLDLNYSMARRLFDHFSPERLMDPASAFIRIPPQLNRARILLRLGMKYRAPAGHPVFSEMLSHLDSLLTGHDPADAFEANNLSGIYHQYCGQRGQAQALYERAINVAPHDNLRQLAETNLKALQMNSFAGAGLV